MIYYDKDARFLDDRDRYLSAGDCGVRDNDQERMALEREQQDCLRSNVSKMSLANDIRHKLKRHRHVP